MLLFLLLSSLENDVVVLEIGIGDGEGNHTFRPLFLSVLLCFGSINLRREAFLLFHESPSGSVLLSALSGSVLLSGLPGS
jgi:hypothetical protein